MPQERSAESWQGFVNTCLSHFPGLGGVFQQVLCGIILVRVALTKYLTSPPLPTRLTDRAQDNEMLSVPSWYVIHYEISTASRPVFIELSSSESQMLLWHKLNLS
jgi:hypothetical protein